MLFNSFEFLIFFPVVTIVYFLLPFRFRWLHLLAASCIFYMAFIPIYILVLFFTIIIDFIAGIKIENSTGFTKKMFLVASIVCNVSVLAFFKYFNFFSENIDALLQSWHITVHHLPILSFILPIGLSFHTFQAMSYTIEVYRGHQKAERHFGIYSLYVMFYPQLVAGPIERPQNILHQLREKHVFNYYDVTDGLKLMAWGMFKKVVIADRLAQFTDPVFNHPHSYNPEVLSIAAIFFSFQIFCDFSGYSDIAIGAAQVLGIRLMKNFNRPYSSQSISEFWKRWHISLSSWFRDYLYISLGGNRVSVPRWYFNLFFVFLVSGLWHGANWTFIIWGALHGFYIIFALMTERHIVLLENKSGLITWPKLLSILNVICVFFLVSFAWIFFRANTLSDAVFIATSALMIIRDIAAMIASHHFRLGLGTLIAPFNLFLSVFFILVLEAVHYLQRSGSILQMLRLKPFYFRWGVYFATVFSIYLFGVFEKRQFIYFQF